jgi:hypothetical protein
VFLGARRSPTSILVEVSRSTKLEEASFFDGTSGWGGVTPLMV